MSLRTFYPECKLKDPATGAVEGTPLGSLPAGVPAAVKKRFLVVPIPGELGIAKTATNLCNGSNL